MDCCLHTLAHHARHSPNEGDQGWLERADEDSTSLRQVGSAVDTTRHPFRATFLQAQMSKQEDPLRWYPAVLLAVRQRRIRMQDERQAE